MKKAPSKKNIQFEKITLERGKIIEITPDMIIGDVVIAYPETLPILKSIGIHCVGCYASTFESIQEGVMRHGLDPFEVCKKLNQTIIKNHQKK